MMCDNLSLYPSPTTLTPQFYPMDDDDDGGGDTGHRPYPSVKRKFSGIQFRLDVEFLQLNTSLVSV